MRGVALCCAGLALAGCSLLLSTSDLNEQSSPDGGGPTPTTDAGADAPANTDAAGDAPVGTPDGGGPFCKSLSPAPKYCADFDDGNVLAFFDGAHRDPMSTTNIVADNGAARIAMANATGCTYARLEKTLPASAAGMKVRFRVRPTAPFTEDEIFANLFIGEGDVGCALLLHVDPNGGSLQVQYGNPQMDDGYDWAVAPKVGEWSDVSIDLAASTIPTVTIRVNGQPAMAKTLSQCSFGAETWLALGLHCASGTAELRYDDVVVDYP
jgi:hypothetical protein